MGGWLTSLTEPFTPARRMGHEILDDPALDPALRQRSHRDIALANAWLGGDRAIALALRTLFRHATRPSLSLADIGTGTGDNLRIAHGEAADAGIELQTFGVDLRAALGAQIQQHGHPICGDARRIPLATASVDVVMCSLLLHHFADDEIDGVVGEMRRVARLAVMVHDLRRSWLAAAGIWLASFPLGFHPISRHDGRTSVLRGFTARELGRALGPGSTVERRLGFRLVGTALA